MLVHPDIIRIILCSALAILLALPMLAFAGGARDDRTYASQAPPSMVAPDGPDGQLVASKGESDGVARTPEPIASTPAVHTRGGVECTAPNRLVDVPRGIVVRSTPGGARSGALRSQSLYLRTPMRAWIQDVTADGRWGKITVPWSKPVNRTGWILLEGLATTSREILVVSDLSDRRVRVYRGCREILSLPSAIGAAASPSPTGRFWVTDRVAVPPTQPYFGSFAFGLSTIQPNPPSWWRGGNQMAIHGTNSPRSIGTAASAGCLRVSETSLARLKPLLEVGTPVVIQA